MDKSNEIINFIKNNKDRLEYDASFGFSIEFPKFDLFPLDYMKFAEKEIEIYNQESDVRNLINSILDIRRALDCEIDIFMNVLNLSGLCKQRNLGLKTKLDFLESVGIINSRTINRFNLFRNKIEHDYQIPKIGDIEVYYDLINALISNIEMSIFSISGHNEINLYVNDEGEKLSKYFSIKYVCDKQVPEIQAKIIDHTDEQKSYSCTITVEELDEFIKCFKLLFKLIQGSNMISFKLTLENI